MLRVRSRGLRLRNRLRRLAEQRDRLFGVKQLLSDSADQRNVVISAASEQADENLELDLLIVDSMPLMLRRILHDYAFCFSAKAFAHMAHWRGVTTAISELRHLEQREIDRFAKELGVTYEGSICRYKTRKRHKRFTSNHHTG